MADINNPQSQGESGFQTPLQVQLLEDRKTWLLLSDFVYANDKGELTPVPEGFQTDFASVPRIPIIFDLVGSYGHAAATLHDYLYAIGKLPRHKCDDTFYQALRDTGIANWRARAMWLGVRAFGWLFYGDRNPQYGKY